MKRELVLGIALVWTAAFAFGEPGDGGDRYVEVFSERMNAQLTKKGGVTVSSMQQESYISPERVPLAAALEYLRHYAKELDFKAELLRTNLAPAKKLEADAKEEYRLWDDAAYRKSNPTIIIFEQTYFGLPVWDGSVRVDMVAQPNGTLEVGGATLSRHPNLVVEKPSAKSMARLENFGDKDLAKALGLYDAGKKPKNAPAESNDLPRLPRGYPPPHEIDPASVKISKREWMIYRYHTNGRVIIGSNTFAPTSPPHFPLPPVDKRNEDGHDYVVLRFTFYGGASGYAYVDPETGSVLYVNAW